MRLTYLCSQPATLYYAWQVEVMLTNFLEVGINPTDIHIVSSHNGVVPEAWNKLVAKFKGVKFAFYRDTRANPSYISSVRPHILEKHWLANPSLVQSRVLYHDCDILIPRKPDFDSLLEDSQIYVSDTVSYIGAKYISSKGEDYLDLMTDIVGVNKQTVIDEEQNSGGAQYLLKYVDAKFWNKVYYDSETLYRVITRKIAKDKPPHPLQIWTADMWAVLWNLWWLNMRVKVTPLLSFCWGTSPVDQYDKHQIYHNAGVTSGQTMFYKAAYITKLPYDVDLSKIDQRFANYKYAEHIAKVGKTSCLK